MAITPTIYWSYTTSSKTLAIGNSSLSGDYSGSFDGTTQFQDASTRPWDTWKGDIRWVNISEAVAPQYTTNWFAEFPDLELINNISNLDTSNVVSMEGMFLNCPQLYNLDVSNFDTSNVTSMVGMFQGCQVIESLDMSSFDTSNVTTMARMFKSCSSLLTLDLSSFDTSNVTTMESMFESCHELASLDILSFDTSNVVNMASMFTNSSTITSLDLSRFDTSSVTNMDLMFGHCRRLKTIYASSLWNMSTVTTSTRMFTGCLDISGAIVYDNNKVDGNYANYNTGYLTYRKLITNLTNTTWYLKDTPSLPSTSTMYDVTLTADNKYTALYIEDSEIKYKKGSGWITYFVTVYTAGSGWDNDEARPITITGGYDTTNTSLILWLLRNATTPQYYQKDAGKWKAVDSYIKVSNVWHNVYRIFTKVSGVWKESYQ